MAERIVCSKEEFESCIAAYKGSMETLQGAVATYEQALNALSSDWTGRAFAAMCAKVASLTMRIKSSFDRVTDAISELEAVEKLFEENETSLTGKFNALDVGSKSNFAG